MNHVRYEVVGHVAVVTLDRPEQLNSFTDQMEAELMACFDRSDKDDDVRAVVITGAGRAFCAGMELLPSENGMGTFQSWRASSAAPAGTQHDVPGEDLPIRRDGGGTLALRIFDSLKPVIAAINGDAVGIGITLTLPCDIRVMSRSARVRFPFTRLGFVPETCSSWFLPRVVPMQRALEWTLTARRIDAAEALEAGLVLSLHDPEDVLTEAMRIADDIAEGVSSVSASMTRQLLWKMLTAEHPMTAHEIETRALNDRGVSQDAHEGTTAFFEKRAAVFPDTVSAMPDFFADLPQPVYAPPKAPHARTAG